MPRNLLNKLEIFIIVVLAFIPLFIRLPYRVNIFLSWEGAYRMSRGQLPFRDFGTPLGGMFWVIPAIFFKIFGTKMITLVKAQVLINIIAGFSFRSILRSLAVRDWVRLVSVLLFWLSYSFFNFWPWYNHSVIVFELAGLAFLFRYIRAMDEGKGSRMGWLLASAFLLCCSFLTKQDGGAMAFLIACGILAVYGLYERRWKPLVFFAASYGVILFLLILPFLRYGFGYWFNHGQAPHSSRVSAFDIADELFGASQWIKFYFFLTLLLVLARYRDRETLRANRKEVLLVFLTWCILLEAAVFQVTSYTPPDNNIFFHSFAFACVCSLLAPLLPVSFDRPRYALVLVVGVLFWWSGIWWKYTERLARKILPHQEAGTRPGGENRVDRSNYLINRDTVKEIPMDQWGDAGLASFARINMPAPTIAGLHRLLDMDLIKRARLSSASADGKAGGLRVLNMSELTPLAVEIPYVLERNSQLPLWYHLGVGMFNRQADTLETRIRQHYYDLVLFEYIPGLNNFYPFRVRDSLRVHYNQVDSFPAPRRGTETIGQVEVFVRRADSLSRY
ncbi:MAG TPA: hypothetical protein VGM30_06810 [Puia sp.]|jgi:hypothetical protein